MYEDAEGLVAQVDSEGEELIYPDSPDEEVIVTAQVQRDIHVPDQEYMTPTEPEPKVLEVEVQEQVEKQPRISNDQPQHSSIDLALMTNLHTLQSRDTPAPPPRPPSSGCC